MPEKTRVGVIGAGNMGAHHARNYFEMPETKLISIADTDKRAAELADRYDAVFYKDYETMLNEESLAAVSVAVPTNLHHEVAMTALKRGVHVLLEKPFASTLAETDDLIAMAAQKEMILTVGHIERYNPVVKKAKEFIASGKLGTISSVISQRLGGFPQKEPSTDVILDLAIHDIDIISYLLGKPGELLACHGSRTFHSNELDSAELLMSYGGISGFIQANWVTPVKIRELAITGSLGYLEANYITQALTHYERMDIEAKDDFEAFVGSFGQPRKHVLKAGVEEPLRNELTAFIATTQGKNAEIVTPIEARDALEIAMNAVKRIRSEQNA